MAEKMVAPTYETARTWSGQQVTVLDAEDHEVARLWVECVTQPVDWQRGRAFSVLLTGPGAEALAAGVYHLRSALADAWLALEQIASDLRYAHYEAYVCSDAV